MKIPVCKISIGSFEFDYVHAVEVSSSWDELTDSATILLPSKLKLDKDSLKDVLAKGDECEVQLGYDDNLQTVFKGYLTAIKPTTPIELSFEDEMWKLKQLNINTSFKGGSLVDFLESVFPGTEIDAFDLQMAPFYADNINGARLLDQIKSDYGLRSFFRNGVLVIGKQYDPNDYKKHIFKIDYNMEGESLEFMSKEDVKIAVRAISNNPDGTKVEVEFGDSDGDTKTLNFYNLDESELRKVAEKELSQMKYDGWRGPFTAFGEPMVKHGDAVELRHATESDKVGTYWIDAVHTTFGIDGFRQEITLGAIT